MLLSGPKDLINYLTEGNKQSKQCIHSKRIYTQISCKWLVNSFVVCVVFMTVFMWPFVIKVFVWAWGESLFTYLGQPVSTAMSLQRANKWLYQKQWQRNMFTLYVYWILSYKETGLCQQEILIYWNALEPCGANSFNYNYVLHLTRYCIPPLSPDELMGYSLLRVKPNLKL